VSALLNSKFGEPRQALRQDIARVRRDMELLPITMTVRPVSMLMLGPPPRGMRATLAWPLRGAKSLNQLATKQRRDQYCGTRDTWRAPARTLGLRGIGKGSLSMKLARILIAGIVPIGVLVPTLSVMAQTGGTITEILVTAERREAQLQDVPLAVSALGAKQLENFQIGESQDLQRVVPSLHMFNNITSPTNLSLSLRGGLQQDASLVVAESPVGMYIDDVYVGRLNNNNATLSDIERVEVLRGPQGTLYGRNTGYGAVKFISRTPGTESWFNATAGYGSDDQILANASAGGPLSDAWAGSLSAQWKEKSGQFDNVFDGSDIGDERNASVRGKLHYMGDDKFDALLFVAYSDTDNDSLQMPHGVTPNVPDSSQFTTDDLVFPNGEWAVNYPREQLAPPPLRDYPQADDQQTIVGLTLSYDINDNLTLKSITGYVGTEDFFHTDFGGDAAASYPPAVGDFVGAADVNSDQYSEELQLLGSAMDERLNFILGAYYLREDADQIFGWHFFSPLSESSIDTQVDSYAVFGQASYQITERLKGTAGLRWTKDEKDFDFDFHRLADNFFDTVVAPGFFPELFDKGCTDPGLSGSESCRTNNSDDWMPKIGLDYSVAPSGAMDGMLLYVQAAKGFKGAGFSAIALASTEPVGKYDAETNWTYEGGMKADWFGNTLRTNLAYFWSEIEDIQQNATVAGSAGFEFPVQNSGDAAIHGLEFELTLVPVDRLNLFVNGSLMHGSYSNLNENSAAGAADDIYGVHARTPQTPAYTVSAGFDYTLDMPGDRFGDFSFGADYYEIDDYITAATNDFYNSGWNVWNAFISQEIGEHWRVKLAGKNLADDFIVTSGSRGLGGFVVLPPREVLLTVTYRYGE
jgi:iron complex outermembrane receptor protein